MKLKIEKQYDIKIEIKEDFDLALTIKADLSPEVPGSQHYPEDPASIEDLVILIEGEEIGQKLQDKIIKKYEEEIYLLIWEEVEVNKAEYLITEAEWKRDSMEDR